MVVRLMRYKVIASGVSDIGRVRQNNEDVWIALPEFGLYCLADGMGGHQAGEIAAREAVNALCRIVKKKRGFKKDALSLEDVKHGVQYAIEQVNLEVFKMSRLHQELRGMGTTLCCLLFHEKGVVYANVGDSRIYRLRGQKMEQITTDHSLLREMIELGQLREEQATDFLYKNIITKAIGTEPKVEPAVKANEVQVDDQYLICSDGLSDLLTSAEIAKVMIESSSIHDSVNQLVAIANQRGGHDNITVVIAKVEKYNEKEDLSR